MWAKRRVVVLDEVQGLSHSAKQALLKPIEDIIDSSIVVLITTDVKSFPATLRSRLMPLEVRTLDTNLSVLLLERVCAREGIKYERKALELIAIAARGHPRDMLTALEQVEMFGDANEDHVRDALDQGDADAVSRYFTAALAGDVAQLVQVWQNWLLGPDEKLRVIQEFLIFLEYREILGVGAIVRPDFLLIPADKRRQLAQSLRSCQERLGMPESAFWEQLKSIWRYGSDSNTDAQVQLSALIFLYLFHGPPPTGATALPKEAPLDAPTTKRRPPPRPRAPHRIRRLRSLGDQQEQKRNAVPLVNRPEHLAMEQVRALWERASVLVQEHQLMFNVGVELNWAEMGITDAATASRRLSDLAAMPACGHERRGACRQLD
jgi:DNA polymerase III, delta subunit